MSIKELDIPIALNTSKDDLINGFFIPLLENSILYDRGVGYFSSGWIKETVQGMHKFALSGGKARWITSPILSKGDWGALTLGSRAQKDEILKKAIVNEIKDLKKSLKEDTLIALAWMIADEIIQFKLAKPRNKLTSEYHAKTGIFTDSEGNSLSFDGSYNDGINGLHNYESIKIFKSWDSTNKYVEHEKKRFEVIWNNNDPNIEVFDIPEAAKAQILKLRENTDRPYPIPEWLRLEKINTATKEIKIPYPNIPENINLRDYQNDAISSWFNNQNRGIFEMATGTGKTFTALSAAVKLLEINKKLLTIIICPYIHLAEQWVNESHKFGYRPILIAEAKSKWLENAYKSVRDFSRHRIDNLAFVTTNASFLSGDFRNIIDEYDVWDQTLLIADEMHHCGSQEMLKVLPPFAPYRLGLSATPIRSYDEVGSEKLLEYFGDIVFKFELGKAIAQGFLTPYFYHPIPVYMKDDEFEEFVVLTKKLNRLHSNSGQPISEAALKIAIKRARVLNNSRSKIEWIRENINDSDDLKHTLFYVGDQIFEEIRQLIGNEKKIQIHEFTHRQNLAQRRNLIEQFEKGDIKAFVAMKCLDEGVDIPPTRTAYFLASSSVPREFVQRRGRVLRNSPGKKSAIIYDLISIPPLEYIVKGKTDENYNAVRSAIRREYTRIIEFASLAENKYQSTSNFIEIANEFDLLDI